MLRLCWRRCKDVMLSGLLNGDLPPNFSGHTLDKATKAKLTLENYYNNLISQQRERRERMRRMEVDI